MDFKHISRRWLIAGMALSGLGLAAGIIWQYSKLWQVFLCSYHGRGSTACVSSFHKETYTTLHGILLVLMQFASITVLALCINAYSSRKKK